jgi:hypothetical protein
MKILYWNVRGPPRRNPTAPAPSDPEQTQGVVYIVGEVSEATFTVEEKLARLPLPNDAVVRTMAISGEVHLDGRPSVISIDLHQLASDQERRDQYIRERMFPDNPILTFTVTNLGQLPEPFPVGEVIARQVSGESSIRGVTKALTFDVEADGPISLGMTWKFLRQTSAAGFRCRTRWKCRCCWPQNRLNPAAASAKVKRKG